MRVSALLAIFVLVLSPLPAAALALFNNPFADAANYRAQRDPASEARYRVRYEMTVQARGGAPVVSELVLDVADDWALVRGQDRVRLFDFRLNRIFTLNGDTFTSNNGLGELVFKIMERQNRSYLQRLLNAAGAQGELADACDAESELSLVIPGAADAGVTELRERRGAFTLRCNGRDIGGFTAGQGAPPPPAFWPAMYVAMPTHPALHRRVRDSGHAPERLNIEYRDGSDTPARRAWRLIAVETASTPYPLEPNLRNATADAIDQLIPGAGRIGAEAVAGRALDGAPTLQSWDAHLRDVSRRDGEAAAAMLLNSTFNMFPELQCGGSVRYTTCDLVSRLREMQDPAPWAVIEIGMREQRGDNAGAIAAMQRAQASSQRDHPALGAAFALAIVRFDEAALAQARAANLPLDIVALQNRALLALPYNPAYWTDVGDRYGRAYAWPNAFMFYDVAFSLPMPSAIERNPALVSKRTQMERIRRDFPDAFLPATP